MSELTKEQLLEYVKKQKLKMKKLEAEIATLKEKTDNVTVTKGSNEDLNHIKLENASLERQLSNKDSEIADLSKTIEELTDEKLRIVSEKNAEIVRLTKMAEQSSIFDEENASMKVRIVELEAIVAAQKLEILESETKAHQLDALQANMVASSDKEAQNCAQVDSLKAELVDARGRADALDDVISELKKQMNELSLSRDEVVASLESGSTVENQLRQELSALQSKCIALSEQLLSTSGECDSLKAATAELTNANSLVNKELSASKENLAIHIASLERANNLVKELSEKVEKSASAQVVLPNTAGPGQPKGPTSETSVPAATGKKKGKNNKKGKDKGQEAAADTTAAPEEPADLTVVVPADTPDVDTTVMEELRQKLRDLEGEHVLVVQQLESSLSAAQAASAAAGAELQQVSAQLSKINAEVAGYVDKQVAWKTREAELLAQAEALESAKNHLAQELSATSTQSSSLQQEQKSKLTNLRAKIAELEEALRSSETAEGLAQQQLRELRASQADHESKLTYHMERVVALELQLKQVQDKSVQQSAQHSAALSAIAQEADDLRAQIASLKLSGDSSASALAATVDKLTAELRVALEQLEASQTAEKTISEELAALKETSVQTESTNKKLMTKLKLKMKECTDLSAELVSAKDTASKSASAEATSSALSEQMQVLQTSLAKVSDAKAELELKSKALNDSVIAGEEKVSALLREKNKLQEDLFTTLHKVESITKEAQGFKTERDLARQQYLDMESKLQGLSSTSREKIDSLSTKVAELSTVNATLSAQNTTLNEALALSNSEITTLKESSSALSQANSKSKGLAATVESLKQQLQEAKMDAENKAEASNERIKKLKLLLTKVNAVSQEKDARLAQLQSLNDRAKKFNIVTRIGVVPPQDPTAEPLEWCLIYEHRSPPAKNGTSSAAAGTDEDSTSSQYRWIEARVAHKWMAEGSTLIGAWPQPVQETWSTEMNALRSRLEAERDEIASKFEEISSQFQTYKVRAQTALKRIGNEDRNERQKAQELESAEIERLRGVIQDLKEKEGDFNEVLSEKVRSIASKDQAIQELQGKIEQLETTMADGEQAYKANERKIDTLQKEIEALVQDSQNMKEQYEAADRSNRERRMQQLRSEEEAALRIATMPQATISSAGSSTSATSAAMSSRNSGQNLQDHSQLDSAASEASSGSALGPSTDSRPMSPKDLDANGSFLHSQQSQQVVSPLRVMSRTPSQSLPSASPRGRSLALEAALSSDLQEGSSTDSKLLLFQQADSILRDSIATLRLENSQLMVEINEMKNDVGLREDQVLALKNTIRELESSLCREKEFNAENRRINADYLVNILRNFLMSTEPSERAKLVPVLCQILHLRADESKIIAEKWAVRTGGLVGWLLPPRPAISTGASPRYQQHATGMNIDRGGGEAGGKGSMGDLTYDPATGGGIDVNGY